MEEIVPIALRILEHAEDMHAIEDLQREVWPGNDVEIVPTHLLVTAAQNGGLLIGAYDLSGKAQPPASGRAQPVYSDFEVLPPADPSLPKWKSTPPLIGFVFGFPGLYFTPDGPRLKHCSHMMGVHPAYRDHGIGYWLKRAQWQTVRHQGIDRITWTYDPLLSRNAHLNIARLGAVCNTYKRDIYGTLRDGLNVGLPSDRFQVDWWVFSRRLEQRLSKQPRQRLDLARYLEAEVAILNPTRLNQAQWPEPAPEWQDNLAHLTAAAEPPALVMVEIPSNFLALKSADANLALEWRLHSRALFETLFEHGYLVTDFVYLPGNTPRSFYILSYGESTL